MPEQKLWCRLYFAIFRRWPRCVVADRLKNARLAVLRSRIEGRRIEL